MVCSLNINLRRNRMPGFPGINKICMPGAASRFVNRDTATKEINWYQAKITTP
jgi:hypothetical protein